MPAPATADEFLDLIQKSGLVNDEPLAAYAQQLRDAGGLPAEPATLASLLVRDGLLTNFQAEQILGGKWRRFAIGKYKVLERLGAGRAGSVYLCQHELARRLVAVKVLPAARAADPSSVERFYREAQVLASLGHPNIVRAYDIDQDETLHFLVMEYVDGSSLQDIVEKGGPMHATRAAHYLKAAAVGIQYPHEQGVVHRDIKPGDILVDRTGLVKLIDMGAAQFINDADNALGGGAHFRADIARLGAAFYFCLTRRTPDQAGRVWAIRQLRPRVPAGLAELIEGMMAKDPSQQPQRAQEVADALAPYTREPIGPPPEDEMPRLSPAVVRLLRGTTPPPP
jgi:serine/threonine protein kinase